MRSFPFGNIHAIRFAGFGDKVGIGEATPLPLDRLMGTDWKKEYRHYLEGAKGRRACARRKAMILPELPFK